MNILLSFANDKAGKFLRHVAEEHAALLEVFAEKGIQPVSLPSVTAEGLVKAFQAQRDAVCLLHYSGHADGYQLVFRSGLQSSAMADAASLADFLSRQKGLKLVFLNGCSTREQAQGLLNAGVQMVIATDTAIEDQAARDFATHFYRSLLGGASVSDAFHEASSATLMSRKADVRQLYRDLLDLGGRTPTQMPWQLFQQGEADWRLPLDELAPVDQEQLRKNIIELRNSSNNQIIQDEGPEEGPAKQNKIMAKDSNGNIIFQDVRKKK